MLHGPERDEADELRKGQMDMSDADKLNGTAYVTVYHTVTVNVGLSWLAIIVVAIAAISLAWKVAI